MGGRRKEGNVESRTDVWPDVWTGLFFRDPRPHRVKTHASTGEGGYDMNMIMVYLYGRPGFETERQTLTVRAVVVAVVVVHPTPLKFEVWPHRIGSSIVGTLCSVLCKVWHDQREMCSGESLVGSTLLQVHYEDRWSMRRSNDAACILQTDRLAIS